MVEDREKPGCRGNPARGHRYAGSLDVMKGKGTFVLSARDIFNTRPRRQIVDQPDYQAESDFQWRRSQQVVLSFNYRLHQDKKKNVNMLGEDRKG